MKKKLYLCCMKKQTDKHDHPTIMTEITPLADSQFLFVRDMQRDSFSFPLHQHTEYELNYIEHGKGRIRIVGDSFEQLGDAELVLIGPRLEHAWEQPDGCAKETMREVTIQFAPTLISKEQLDKEHFAGVRNLLQRAERGIAFGPDAIKHVSDLLEVVAHAQAGFYRYIRLLELLYLLAGEEDYHILSSSQFAKTQTTEDSTRMQKVIDYIQAHFREEIRLTALADQIGMSPSAFSRFFSQRTGKSLTDYLLDMRIGFATRRLIDTTDTIAEICYDSGFSTLSNFNRIFKERKGCTPREFRQNYLQKCVIID